MLKLFSLLNFLFLNFQGLDMGALSPSFKIDKNLSESPYASTPLTWIFHSRFNLTRLTLNITIFLMDYCTDWYNIHLAQRCKLSLMSRENCLLQPTSDSANRNDATTTGKDNRVMRGNFILSYYNSVIFYVFVMHLHVSL